MNQTQDDWKCFEWNSFFFEIIHIVIDLTEQGWQRREYGKKVAPVVPELLISVSLIQTYAGAKLLRPAYCLRE